MMVGQTNPKTQPPSLTPRDDIKKMVSEILKRVDNFVRKGDLDQAQQCVAQAREIDPKNIYAFAFEERIHILKEQAHENALAAAACKAAEARKKQEETQRLRVVTELKKEPPKPKPAERPVIQEDPIPIAQRCIKPAVEISESQADKEPAHPQEEQERNRTAAEAVRRAQEEREVKIQMATEEENNLKIKRMVKEAVEAVRKEVAQEQSIVRTKELEELARKDQMKIKQAAEAARHLEEERQQELRKQLEEKLMRKIREEYRQKFIEDSLAVKQTEVPDSTKKTPQDPTRLAAPPPDADSKNPARQETLSRYKLVLSSVWADGAFSPEEEATLKELRGSLGVSIEEHSRLEREVKYETYIEAFKKAWHSGTITPENASVLADLRRRFQISNEEHLRIEAKLLWEIQPVKHRPSLLFIDDDERLLNVVTKTLNEAGFITTSVTTSDEAYAYLQESSPDLILCDVNLETSTMGGFAFYEKVRELDRLRQTPFIFLSGLSDEALVRTGKEMGVDDYLSKPISEETLIATIKGKLRRYQELKERMN
jgi:CheY-like chemotaxis protein